MLKLQLFNISLIGYIFYFLSYITLILSLSSGNLKSRFYFFCSTSPKSNNNIMEENMKILQKRIHLLKTSHILHYGVAILLYS
jgi:hypothetical protein